MMQRIVRRWGLAVLAIVFAMAAAARADLVQYWRFDETGTTSTAANSVVGGLDGTLMRGDGDDFPPMGVNTSPVWSTDVPLALNPLSGGHSTGSLQFESSLNEWVDVGALGLSSTNNALTNPNDRHGVTVSMWIKPGDDLSATMLYDWTNDGSNPNGICNSGPRIENGDTGSSDPGYLSIMGRKTDDSAYLWRGLTWGGSIVTDEWQHLAISYLGDCAYVFINGVQQPRMASRTAFTFDGAGFGIGAKRRVKLASTGGSYKCFDGLMDDVAIWDTVLTPDAIAELAAGTAPTDIVERAEQPDYAQVVNIDIGTGVLPAYSGQGAVEDAGTVWNAPVVSGSVVGFYSCSLSNAVDSGGAATSIGIDMDNFHGQGADGASPDFEDPNPLMGDRIWARNTSTNDWEISGLQVGATYDIYFLGLIETTVNLHAGAVADSAEIVLDTSYYFRINGDSPEDYPEGIAYAKLTVTPTATTISGTIDPYYEEGVTGARGSYLCGLQIARLPGSTMIPGDTNNDNRVDATDAATMADHWGRDDVTGPQYGDFNSDGKIDMLDASIMAANWGDHTTESSAVPEPATLVMLLGLPLLVLGRRR